MNIRLIDFIDNKVYTDIDKCKVILNNIIEGFYKCDNGCVDRNRFNYNSKMAIMTMDILKGQIIN